jgi:hypothetical protein
MANQEHLDLLIEECVQNDMFSGNSRKAYLWMFRSSIGFLPRNREEK